MITNEAAVGESPRDLVGRYLEADAGPGESGVRIEKAERRVLAAAQHRQVYSAASARPGYAWAGFRDPRRSFVAYGLIYTVDIGIVLRRGERKRRVQQTDRP